MYARALEMLHDARHEDVLPVADGINLNLFAHQIFIDQNRVVDAVPRNYFHILGYIGVVISYYHVLATQNIRRTQQHGVAERICGSHCLLALIDAVPCGARYCAPFKDLVKTLPVLGGVNAVGAGAENIDAKLLKMLCQLYGRLTAKLHDDTPWFLGLKYAVDILWGKRIEIQPVAGVKIS